jgi:excisionase family DNA binding protein
MPDIKRLVVSLTKDMEVIMTVNEISRKLNMPKTYVYTLITQGRFVGHKIDGVWSVEPEAVEAYLQMQERRRARLSASQNS